MAFDTADGTLKPLGAAWTSSESVEMAPCDAEGKTYTVSRWGLEEPEDPADGEVFLKVKAESSPWNADGVLEVYSSSLERWTGVTLDYCKISATGIGADFAVWDTVTVEGTAAAAAGLCEDLDGEKVLYDAGEDWLMVRITPGGEHFYGRILQTGTEASWSSLDGKSNLSYSSDKPLRCTRRVPDLDYLTECDNRVWGCSGSENVIYACKLGDPTNWFSYRNTAADSYAVTVGSDGDFTGAAACMGYVLFFKEGHLHGVCIVLQREQPAQAVREQALGLPAQQPAVPRGGQTRRRKPLRHQRDAVLSFARRGDGLGRQPAGEGVGDAGPQRPDRSPAGRRRLAGRAVLPLPEAGRGEPAAGLRHRARPLARGGPRRDGRAGNAVQRAPAVPVGREPRGPPPVGWTGGTTST